MRWRTPPGKQCVADHGEGWLSSLTAAQWTSSLQAGLFEVLTYGTWRQLGRSDGSYLSCN